MNFWLTLNMVSNMLRPQKGNMYDWITHTWNPIKGKCQHGCHYCYMKRWGDQKPARFVESEMKTDLGSGNVIFVGSSCDMWAHDIYPCWIEIVIDYCKEFENKYLFQTKNPSRIADWHYLLPPDTIIGTTIESDIICDEMGSAPEVIKRYRAIKALKLIGFKTMITIEPIMRFSQTLIDWVIDAKPDFVNIGANTNAKVKLQEPTRAEIDDLVKQISAHTEIKIKSNLSRIK